MDWDFLKTDGRMRRTNFALWSLGLFFVAPAIAAIPVGILGFESRIANLATSMLMIPIIHVTWCVSVQRAHDMGRSWGIVGLTWALFGGSVIMLMMAVVNLLSRGEGMSLLAGSGLMAVLSVILSGILALAPPDDGDLWGPDPR